MRDGFRVFDALTHLPVPRNNAHRPAVDEILRDMDRAGVDRVVLVPLSPGDDCRSGHDVVGDIVLAYPDRFVGVACFSPALSLEEFAAEVRRCRETYGFRALKYVAQSQVLNPLSTRIEFLFDAAGENDLAVILQTGAGPPFSLPSLYMPAARQYPQLDIVLSQCGGGLLSGEAIVSALFCPNIYLELSTLPPQHIAEVLVNVPSARLMIGSDRLAAQDAEMSKILNLPVTDEDKQNILHATADRVFGAG